MPLGRREQRNQPVNRKALHQQDAPDQPGRNEQLQHTGTEALAPDHGPHFQQRPKEHAEQQQVRTPARVTAGVVTGDVESKPERDKETRGGNRKPEGVVQEARAAEHEGAEHEVEPHHCQQVGYGKDGNSAKQEGKVPPHVGGRPPLEPEPHRQHLLVTGPRGSDGLGWSSLHQRRRRLLELKLPCRCGFS